MSGELTLGLNQYTHSASACLLNAEGEILIALSKERLTRKKHDGGDVAELVRHTLEQCNVSLNDIGLVVANNHLFRVDAFESTLHWAQALNQYRPSYLDQHNLLPRIEKHELSHHLAHAWSAFPFCPFEKGLIVVMDGMGNTKEEAERTGDYFHSDLSLPKSENFKEVPDSNAFSNGKGWREGESVYRFEGHDLELLFKRWICENTPTLLYNYGFENMESLGAVYSRISSHIFGDWNSCGKVMGMAPWAEKWNQGKKENQPDWILRGPLEKLEVNWERLRSTAHPNEWSDSQNHPLYAQLSSDLQRDLEKTVLDFLKGLQEKTGEKNLCLVGGVALNCALNGRLAMEAGFENVFVPPWPGDDGLAVGCALYGYSQKNAFQKPTASPYLGTQFDEPEILEYLSRYQSWVGCYLSPDATSAIADELAEGKTVATFRGPAEFGPRALGNRSILADPRVEDMVDRINSAIKKREGFRPFAPVVRAESVKDYFDFQGSSPFMSFTAQVKNKCLPAITHVDGSARLQTLAREENPDFDDLLIAFEKRTGIPILLNTSFNLAGEPLVETPENAIQTFLDSELDLLVLGKYLVRKKSFPSDLEAIPIHAPGNAEMISDQEGEPLNVRISSAGRTHDSDALELGIWEACDGKASISEIQAWFQEEHGESAEGVQSRLKRLWQKRLIKFQHPEKIPI